MDPAKLRRRIWYVIAVLWVIILARTLVGAPDGTRIPYTEFKSRVAAGAVADAAVASREVRGRTRDGKSFSTVRVDDPDLLRDLTAHGVKVTGIDDRGAGSLVSLIGWILPLGLLVAFWVIMARRMGGPGGTGFMTIGKSRAKIYMEKEVKVTFADAAGVDEAKDELGEVIEFLRTPERFRRLGGKIPKGILLVGPPGTGKTLLARAVAGEAGVPFFSISGSEFVEMFVGVGAARVRDLFLQARQRAPCIIFIDELDALGKVRGVGPIAHEEREQTLNQLLVELDGFDPRSGVILMAATNRPEILDPALLRAGRFDRHVLVDRPDKPGRLAILKVHTRTVPVEKEADLETVAGLTAGLVGADLANLINEAALMAARRERKSVGLAELQEAFERIVAGLEKRNRVLTRKERERVAHHEVGHATVALLIPGSDAVQKISIIPRGISALGYTLQLPTEDRFLMTQAELENKIAVLLGGRVAEELTYGDVSTGAHDDLLKATDIARSMVRAYGMSPSLGPLSFDREQRLLPAAHPTPPITPPEYGEEVSREIDREVRRILDEQQGRVKRMLEPRLARLREAAGSLLERETLTGDELRASLRLEEAPGGAEAETAH